MRISVALGIIALALVFTPGCNNREQEAKQRQQQAESDLQAAMEAQRLAEEKAREEQRAQEKAARLASVNSVCPVTGDPVDPAVTPVPVEVMIVHPSQIILVGTSSEEAADIVRRDPGRYAAAAQQNRQARNYTKVGR